MQKEPGKPDIVPLSRIIAALESGVSVNGEDRPVSNGEPGVLKVSSVSGGRFIPGENKAIVAAERPKAALSPSPRMGDILISRSNTLDLVGACGYVEKDHPNLYLPDKLWRVVFRDLQRDHAQWLLHVLDSRVVRAALKAKATGTSGSMKNISKSSFLNIRVQRPSFEEQVGIAAILDCWGRAEGQLEALIGAKLRLKQGLMQQLLTGKRRFREFLPSKFVVHQIGDVLRETPRPVSWDESELYRLTGIRRHSGRLFWRESLYGRQIKVKRLYTIHEDDFLISQRQAAYGAMGRVSREFAGGKVSDMYTVLTPRDPDRIDMRFIDCLSRTRRMRHQAYMACNGFFAERLRLNFDPAEFLKQTIRLPERIEEQRKIADVLDAQTKEVLTLEGQLAALKQQKKGLMQKLLTGEVRVRL